MQRTRSSGTPWSPRRLFATGAEGVWFDPSDFSTLYQDAAGTTPVTAVGQPVGKILDKSGRGNHASQSTTTSRPLLQKDASGYYYLSLDGVDDFLVTGSIDLTSTNKVAAFVGVTKLSDAATAILYELSAATDTNPGSFFLCAPRGGGTKDYGSRIAGSPAGTFQDATAANGSLPAPISNVVTLTGDIAAATQSLRANGSQVASTNASVGTGNFGNYPLYIGRRGGSSLPFTGRIYGLVVVGAAQSAANITLAERSVGAKMGIAL